MERAKARNAIRFTSINVRRSRDLWNGLQLPVRLKAPPLQDPSKDSRSQDPSKGCQSPDL